MTSENRSAQEDGARPIPHLQSLRVRNFRALQSLDLDDLSPLSVLVGPNGSGKSTVFEALEFLAACFGEGLPAAWKRYGGLPALRTRGQTGRVAIHVKYREEPGASLMHYLIEIEEKDDQPVVAAESLSQEDPDRVGSTGVRAVILQRNGNRVQAGNVHHYGLVHELQDFEMADRSTLAAPVLGQLTMFPLVQGLRSFIRGWHVSRFSLQAARTDSELTVEDRLTPSGSNIASVVFWLQQQPPERLATIVERMRRDVPNLAGIAAKVMESPRMRLLFQDAPFTEPVPAQRASDGTLTLLAYLLLLQGGEPYSLLCLDEPENNLHPRLLPDLAETCRAAAERSQLLVITHSPEFLGGIRAEELRVLYRDEAGFTQAVRAADIRGIPELMAAGASLGQLWLEGHFGVGDPLVNEGRPQRNPRGPA
jgi:predicted ATPase